MLAHLTAVRNYSITALSEYLYQFVSSVEVIGAILVTNGTCFLDDTSIAMNVSTRIPSSKGISYNVFNRLEILCLSPSIWILMCEDYNSDIGDSINVTAMIARQILQLSIIVTTQLPEPRDPRPSGLTGLVIGLVVVAVVLTVMLTVVTVIIIWNRIHKTKR